jgi:hypothetical protein
MALLSAPVELKNLIMAFETLATSKTLDDAYLLAEDLGYKDRVILVGHKGITNLGRVCSEPEWAKQPMEKVLIKFKGGPGPEICGHSIFTASVRAYIVDRLIKTVMASGIDPALESIRTIWGINVRTANDPVLSN